MRNDMDFCDLDPTKICDNCCKCIDTGRDYEEFQLEELTHRISDIDELDADIYEDTAEEVDMDIYDSDDVEYSADPSHVPPIDIDPVLMAEWERKLKIAEIEDNRKLIQNLHGSRKTKK